MLSAAIFASLLTARLALPIVAIDAGHGGLHDGATGVCGLVEKDVTLKLAERTAAILTASRLATPLLLRHGDETLGLTERATRAQEGGAALLISIHANASPSPQARGIETFFLSNQAASGRLQHLADRENEGIRAPPHRSHDVALERILHGLSLDAAHSESQQLALTTQQVLSKRLGNRGRGVLQAPFMVLLGASMAAVLVEVGFLTHPQECVLLASPTHQETIAEALATAALAHLATQGGTLARQ